jgi:hypothetical protein
LYHRQHYLITFCPKSQTISGPLKYLLALTGIPLIFGLKFDINGAACCEDRHFIIRLPGDYYLVQGVF